MLRWLPRPYRVIRMPSVRTVAWVVGYHRAKRKCTRLDAELPHEHRGDWHVFSEVSWSEWLWKRRSG